LLGLDFEGEVAVLLEDAVKQERGAAAAACADDLVADFLDDPIIKNR
jgi:hypothetical protein